MLHPTDEPGTTIATLANGVRVVMIDLPGVGSASVSVFVRTGSAHESPALNGISHVLEHMVFKGTERRDARAITLEIERVGEGQRYMTRVLGSGAAEPLAVRSVPHMLETLARFRAEGAGVKVAGILLTMVMREHEMSLRVARELREMLPANLLFQQSIPRMPSFLDASALGVPVALTKRNPPPEALIFDQIAAELEQRAGIGAELGGVPVERRAVEIAAGVF